MELFLGFTHSGYSLPLLFPLNTFFVELHSEGPTTVIRPSENKADFLLFSAKDETE